MTKSELIYKLKQRMPKLSEAEIEVAMDKIIGFISESLAEQNRVELRGFGAFSIRKRESHTARNPKNGEIVHVENRNFIYFRAGKELRERINK
jgi:integration host factor subunit beta